MAGDLDAKAVPKTLRIDKKLLDKLRARIIEKLYARPAKETGRVPVASDEWFVAVFGHGLADLSDTKLVRIAIENMFVTVAKSPDGLTGIEEFDGNRSSIL